MAHRAQASALTPRLALYLPLPHPSRSLQKSHLDHSLTYGSYLPLGSFLVDAYFSLAALIVSVRVTAHGEGTHTTDEGLK